MSRRAPVAAGAGDMAAPGLAARARQALARMPVLHLARRALFVGVLALVWLTLEPFPDLSGLDSGDLATGRQGLTYALFGLLAATCLLLAHGDHRRALATCASRANLCLAAWLALSVVLSRDPGTSLKRLALTGFGLALAAALPLLPRSRAEFRDLVAAAALALLAVCWAGLVLAPGSAIHQVTDFLEPDLAGDWRGSFGHKNMAAGVMTTVLFIGLAVFRMGAPLRGAAIAALAGLFLVGSGGKSALALAAAVLALSGLFRFVRAGAVRAVLVLGLVLVLNLLSVGTVIDDRLAAAVAALPIDATFTGRDGIWRFAVESFLAKPVTGYGFAAFWGNAAVRDVAAEADSWAGTASHSHNGYLDAALGLGIVGLVLTVAVFVVGPLRDYQRAPATPLATLFAQIWLFGIFLSCTESFLYDGVDPIWMTFLLAVFGLHYLARFRIA